MPTHIFNSLTHARTVRDRAAEWCLADLRRVCHTPEQASDVLERVCRAEEGWEAEVESWHEDFLRTWDGYGIPEWSHVDELKAAVAYIAAAERAVPTANA